MDCTVDSMLTTTPRFKPREGCEPRPTTSMRPSLVISPTIATTFEVPISSPTIKLRSFFLAIRYLLRSAVGCRRKHVLGLFHLHSLLLSAHASGVTSSDPRATRLGAFQPTEKPLL